MSGSHWTLRLIALLTPLLATGVLGCTHAQKAELRYPIEGRDDKGDLISVQTALDLGLSSYVLGCMEAEKEHAPEQKVKKGTHKACMKKGKAHIRENVTFILDQSGKAAK